MGLELALLPFTLDAFASHSKAVIPVARRSAVDAVWESVEKLGIPRRPLRDATASFSAHVINEAQESFMEDPYGKDLCWAYVKELLPLLIDDKPSHGFLAALPQADRVVLYWN